MRYFNGFSLQHEEDHFSAYIDKSALCVAGFSYGAQKAFEHVYRSKARVDRLILLSPAFFQKEKPSFLRTQLRYFEAGKEAYVKQFLENVSYPSDIDLGSCLLLGTREELKDLLSYIWDPAKLEEIRQRGTVIEVYLGEKDKIIPAKEALAFFTPLATCYFLKDAGHLLALKN